MTRAFLDFRVDQAGPGRYGRELIAAIKRLPEAPEILVFDRGSSFWSRLSRAPFTPWGRWNVYKTAKANSVGIIHGLHVEVPKSNPIPAIATIQDLIPLDYPRSMPNPARRSAYRAVVQSSMRIATRIIVPSEATASALIRHGCKPEKIVVIPLGVSPQFRPSTDLEQREARRRFGGGQIYVAATVSPKAHKNVDGLAQAAALIGAKAGVAVVCNGSETRVPPPLRFIGRLSDEDLRSFYGGSEVFILPSLIEGFGLPALEALACGTPAVCGVEVGALPYIRSGAIEVDVSDPTQIAAAVQRLLDDTSLRGRLSSEGVTLSERLTTRRMAEQTLVVYREAGNFLSNTGP
jgi:glycosyltransferase involved in cell wall biosynthesis